MDINSYIKMFEDSKIKESSKYIKCYKKREFPAEYIGEYENEETKKLKSETISFSNQKVKSELYKAEETYQKFIVEFENKEVNELECEDNSSSNHKVKLELDEAEKIYQKFIRESVEEQKVQSKTNEAQKIYHKFIHLSYEDTAVKFEKECITCRKTFSSAKSYFIHKTSLKHQRKEAALEKFECETCKLTLFGKEQFDLHINSNKHKKKLRNWELEKKLEKKYKLSQIPTVRADDGIKYYFCPLCDKKCLTLICYDSHIASTFHKIMTEEEHQPKSRHINTKYFLKKNFAKNRIATSRGQPGYVGEFQNISKLSWKSRGQPEKVMEIKNRSKMSWKSQEQPEKVMEIKNIPKMSWKSQGQPGKVRDNLEKSVTTCKSQGQTVKVDKIQTISKIS